MDTLQYLTERINFLKLKLDSIQHSDDLKELNIKINEQADIVSNVGGFYESAWLKLIIVISVLGIIIPLLIQYFQKSNLKQITDFLSKEIKETFNLRIKELENSNSEQIDKLSKKVNSELETLKTSHNYISNELEASLFYLQGKQNYSGKRYATALKDYIKSTEFWLKSSKPDRVSVPLSNIELCINNLKTIAAFNKALEDYDINWNSFINYITEHVPRNDKIREIKIAINKLEK